MGRFLYHAACPSCGSRDNLAVYDDNEHCFGCGYHKNTDGQEQEQGRERSWTGAKMSALIKGEIKAIAKRGLNEETCLLIHRPN